MNTLIGAAAALPMSPLSFAGHHHHDRGEHPAHGQPAYGQERYVRSEFADQSHCRSLRKHRYETALDRDLDGYGLTYRHNGRIFQARWPHAPGAGIPVDVDVRPARY